MADSDGGGWGGYAVTGRQRVTEGCEGQAVTWRQWRAEGDRETVEGRE